MAKRIEVIDGIFLITDTITSQIEVRTPATNIFHTEYVSRVFFFLQEEDERTLGYLWSDMVDENDDPFGSLQDLLDYLAANIGEAATPGAPSLVSLYRADYDIPSKYIYSGFLFNLVPTIRRTRDSVKTEAINVTDLTTDWANRLSLTYSKII